MKQRMIIFFILLIMSLNAGDRDSTAARTTLQPTSPNAAAPGSSHKELLKKVKEILKYTEETVNQEAREATKKLIKELIQISYAELYTKIDHLENGTPEDQLKHLLHLIKKLEAHHEMLEEKAKKSTNVLLYKAIKDLSTQMSNLRAWATMLKKKTTLQPEPIAIFSKNSSRQKIEIIEEPKGLPVEPRVQQKPAPTEQTAVIQPATQPATRIDTEKTASSPTAKARLSGGTAIITGIAALLFYRHQHRLRAKMRKLSGDNNIIKTMKKNQDNVYSDELKNLYNQYQTAQQSAIASGIITAAAAAALPFVMRTK